MQENASASSRPSRSFDEIMRRWDAQRELDAAQSVQVEELFERDARLNEYHNARMARWRVEGARDSRQT